MTAMAKGLARSPFISLWAKAHWLLPPEVLGWGFAGREEGLSATDRKKCKGEGDGSGERDTIWVPRTESQQCRTKIERKGRHGGCGLPVISAGRWGGRETRRAATAEDG